MAFKELKNPQDVFNLDQEVHNRIYSCISKPMNRSTVKIVDDIQTDEVHLEGVADNLEAEKGPEFENIELRLNHVVLPKLQKAKLVDFDYENNIVGPTDLTGYGASLTEIFSPESAKLLSDGFIRNLVPKMEQSERDKFTYEEFLEFTVEYSSQDDLTSFDDIYDRAKMVLGKKISKMEEYGLIDREEDPPYPEGDIIYNEDFFRFDV